MCYESGSQPTFSYTEFGPKSSDGYQLKLISPASVTGTSAAVEFEVLPLELLPDDEVEDGKCIIYWGEPERAPHQSDPTGVSLQLKIGNLVSSQRLATKQKI